MPAGALTLPRKCTYIDYKDVDWNDPGSTVLNAVKQGFNVVILCFWLPESGPADMLIAWSSMTAERINEVMSAVHMDGAIVIASCGGATSYPYSLDPVTAATTFAQWCVDQGLDGCDCDLEGFGPGFTAAGMNGQQTTQWVVTFTNTIRSVIGSARYLTHSPQCPYLCAAWVGGATYGYLGIMQPSQAGNAIDFLNVQTYNQGANYLTYETTFLVSGSDFPNSAFAQISSLYGIPLSKLVLTQLVCPEGGGSGWHAASDIATWITRAAADLNYNSGLSLWDYGTCNDKSTAGQYIQTVYPTQAMLTS